MRNAGKPAGTTRTHLHKVQPLWVVSDGSLIQSPLNGGKHLTRHTCTPQHSTAQTHNALSAGHRKKPACVRAECSSSALSMVANISPDTPADRHNTAQHTMATEMPRGRKNAAQRTGQQHCGATQCSVFEPWQLSTAVCKPISRTASQ